MVYPVKLPKVDKQQIREVSATINSVQLGTSVKQLTTMANVKKTCIYYRINEENNKENSSLSVEPLVIRIERFSMHPSDFVVEFVKWFDNPETF